MMQLGRRALIGSVPAIAMGVAVGRAAHAASARELNRDADAVLKNLYATETKARQLSQRAKGILVFPQILKAGFIVGGQGGDGVLRVGGRSTGYYNIAAASFGLQAGAQEFAYVMFFITQSALDYLNKSNGWQLGSGPSIVLVDKGVAGSITTTTLTQDVYVFAFHQRGLMAGIGLEGSKITRITPGA